MQGRTMVSISRLQEHIVQQDWTDDLENIYIIGHHVLQWTKVILDCLQFSFFYFLSLACLKLTE
jgi:hypothetical protein